jgi:hypothetical protein
MVWSPIAVAKGRTAGRAGRHAFQPSPIAANRHATRAIRRIRGPDPVIGAGSVPGVACRRSLERRAVRRTLVLRSP